MNVKLSCLWFCEPHSCLQVDTSFIRVDSLTLVTTSRRSHIAYSMCWGRGSRWTFWARIARSLSIHCLMSIFEGFTFPIANSRCEWRDILDQNSSPWSCGTWKFHGDKYGSLKFISSLLWCISKNLFCDYLIKIINPFSKKKNSW